MAKPAWPALSVVATAVGAALIITCGYPSIPRPGGGAGGGDAGFQDAPGTIADVPHGDAGLDAPAPNDEIGRSCVSTSNTCPSTDPLCITATGSSYFCSETCGSGPCGSGGTGSACLSPPPPPPPGGDALCAQQKASSSATPRCIFYGQGSGTGSQAVIWLCGLQCGTSGSTSFGTCPPPLTCTSNVCQ